jgi:hypothetical protein
MVMKKVFRRRLRMLLQVLLDRVLTCLHKPWMTVGIFGGDLCSLRSQLVGESGAVGQQTESTTHRKQKH